MTLSIPLWTLVPVALVVLGLWLATRNNGPWDFLTPLASLACFAGAALFMFGRWLA